MVSFSEYELQAAMARMHKHPANTGGVDKESELHKQVLAYCKSQSWIVFHGSMAHQSFRTLGEPDCVILADAGRLIMVELKTAKGKLSTDQLAIHAWAEKLGHKILVARSLKEFIEQIKP